jgi:endonuclease G
MTRREDPIWGTGDAPARGNSDSMHVTNVVPQMQPFNAGVWLDLEQFALQNARKDKMKISVFTGPFLTDDDPVKFGVRVPVEFWKVIAFIHDETGRLSATGYTMSQQDFLAEEEFVFGQHKTTQTSIATIEQRAGLSFGDLSRHDPLDVIESPTTELIDGSQIRFV